MNKKAAVGIGLGIAAIIVAIAISKKDKKEEYEAGKDVRTKDCVDAIVQKYPYTKPSEWKRRSKKKKDSGIQRIFENNKTGEKVICNSLLDKIESIESVGHSTTQT